MTTILLPDDKWERIYAFLESYPRIHTADEAGVRRFVEAVLWMARSGAAWRLLPERYGDWNKVYKRYARWCDQEVWEAMLAHFANDPDLENVLIDSTAVRAHPCAAGAPAEKGGTSAQALGRSRGGYGTKIHATTDALGNPLRFVLTGAQSHDVTQAEPLIAQVEALAKQLQQSITRLIADKGYDAERLRELLRARDIEPVVPYRQRKPESEKQGKSGKNKSPTQPAEPIASPQIDWHTYKERHLIECFFNRIKHYRRLFSRFDKLASRYLGFLHLVSALIWLR